MGKKKISEEFKLKAWEIASCIEEFAPISTQVEWDNSGFSIGGANRDVRKALIALNCTLSVVKEAIAKKCDMIVTHHPLIIHAPLLNIMDDDLRGETIALAIKNGITIYSSHTPLDKAIGGLNTIMAKRIGIKRPKELIEGGFGAYGELEKPLTSKELIERIKKSFGTSNLRTSLPIKEKIIKVAVSSGGGQGSIRDALSVGAQVLVTGDVTHHNFYLPNGFMIIDVGHHFSEWSATELLQKLIQKKFPKFATLISEDDTSPIFYF